MKHSLLAMVILGTTLLHSLASGEIPGVQSFKFEGCEVVCIQDTAMKFPPSLFTDAANTGSRPAEESFESSVNVFLVRKEGKSFLIDAGNDSRAGRFGKSLARWACLQRRYRTSSLPTSIPTTSAGFYGTGSPSFRTPQSTSPKSNTRPGKRIPHVALLESTWHRMRGKSTNSNTLTHFPAESGQKSGPGILLGIQSSGFRWKDSRRLCS